MVDLVAWRGVEPERADAAAVTFGRRSLRASGSSLTREVTVTYDLETGDGWITRRMRVRVSAKDWWRSLDLTRHQDGQWSALVDGENDDHLGHATLADGLDAALDCDLQECLLTNTMPVLRHDLHRTAASVDFVMAWISVPDLSVHASPQTYAGDGSADVVFRSGDFVATLKLDDDGLVVDYPGLGSRIWRAATAGAAA
ncbi:putative glycolipid-binding domain-containing protein [Fodinicola acaciae]|uniref:putative glycolipid-binding domain-containing protein n=1 Tax=Fodinicola acaciae TaxID=2681555 RepID=UPI0013D0D1DA|nr:putative glycolipid-binding domain-containing protein [Fodinicola acaciae]